MTEPRYKRGDTVFVDRVWIETTRDPFKRLEGSLTVTRVTPSRGCESGFMVAVRAKNGYAHELDQNWFKGAPVDSG
jgi:hypothetical protein